MPFALKLDMARQAWDEARHVEISVKLSDWMGSEIGQFAENTVLFEAACSTDPVLRLAGVNRALEGLAIDVFTTMKEFGDLAGDPYLEFCEDWMLADEVTHVKMGSDWLRRVTENDPERRKKALEFQSVVDKSVSASAAPARDIQRVAHRSGPPVPRAGRLHRRRGRRDRRGQPGGARGAQGVAAASMQADAADAARRRMTVTVAPHEFRFVTFDAALIERVADELVAALGIDRPVHIEVDETTPLGRVTRRRRRRRIDRPRRERRVRGLEASPASRARRPPPSTSAACCCASATGCSGGFGEAPPDDELSLAPDGRVGDVLRRPPRAPGPHRQPAAVALQLPQSPRVHRRAPTPRSTRSGRPTASPGASSKRSAPQHRDHCRAAHGGALASRHAGRSAVRVSPGHPGRPAVVPVLAPRSRAQRHDRPAWVASLRGPSCTTHSTNRSRARCWPTRARRARARSSTTRSPRRTRERCAALAAPDLLGAVFASSSPRRLYVERFDNDPLLLGDAEGLFTPEVVLPDFIRIDGEYEARTTLVLTADAWWPWHEARSEPVA